MIASLLRPDALILALAGVLVLIAAWIPRHLEHRPMSLPIVLVGIGATVFAIPALHPPDPRVHAELVEHLTEAGVLVALMGAGLKLDRPIGLRSWGTTWRLLGIAMPLTIAGIAFVGWRVLGLGAAGSLLLGSVLAPTDPVLAADVQVGEPTIDGATSLHSEDEVRFSLTSEAGLNDGLAFPFVYGAVLLALNDAGKDHRSLAEWAIVDVFYRLAVGVFVGVVVGRFLGRFMFRSIGRMAALAESADGFVAVGATLLAYGATELAHGYGFVAVFVAAVALRNAERRHVVHQVLHDFARQLEELLVVGLLVLFGGALVNGLLQDLSWAGAATAFIAVFVVRPVTGRLALVRSTVRSPERRAIAFFGVRGIGSLYYLTFAFLAAPFQDRDVLWSTVSFAILLSIIVHGVAATPVMRRLDLLREARHRKPKERVPEQELEPV